MELGSTVGKAFQEVRDLVSLVGPYSDKAAQLMRLSSLGHFRLDSPANKSIYVVRS